ncbi:uncharacterized protein BDZ99DRAFT_248058 [Mytilinidion resinicola]|uniref:Uncharacterized protein n=1 Tax=Mytilinidion resinicola TaxID=574789 RepID=A0A6A6YW49_9PEZI|nr:uncharacterized protein BDZ99DRAFT_248058 [Mytilinidion resinicola]KAF2813031.1 hypothetical protein BDZ99DRAFT_248058 [Mytilinidion resinicola]
MAEMTLQAELPHAAGPRPPLLSPTLEHNLPASRWLWHLAPLISQQHRRPQPCPPKALSSVGWLCTRPASPDGPIHFSAARVCRCRRAQPAAIHDARYNDADWMQGPHGIRSCSVCSSCVHAQRNTHRASFLLSSTASTTIATVQIVRPPGRGMATKCAGTQKTARSNRGQPCASASCRPSVASSRMTRMRRLHPAT